MLPLRQYINERYISADSLINMIATYEIRQKERNKSLVCFYNEDLHDEKEPSEINSIEVSGTLKIDYYVDGRAVGYDYHVIG